MRTERQAAPSTAGSTNPHRAGGQHVIVDAFGCDRTLLNDRRRLRELLVSGCRRAGATVLDVKAEQFEPHGVTVVAVLAESHASVHTYPEHGQAFIDVFTCGDLEPAVAVERLLDALQPERADWRSLLRGVPTFHVERETADSGRLADCTAGERTAGDGQCGPEAASIVAPLVRPSPFKCPNCYGEALPADEVPCWKCGSRRARQASAPVRTPESPAKGSIAHRAEPRPTDDGIAAAIEMTPAGDESSQREPSRAVSSRLTEVER